MKKFLLCAAIAIFSGLTSAATVMQCDPNETGSSAYPNVVCDSTGKLITTTVSQGNSGALVLGSGTITTGGTSQQVFASNTSRKYLFIQNTSSTNEYIGFNVAASTTTGILLLPNSSFSMENGYISTQIINILGATTGQTFVAYYGQ